MAADEQLLTSLSPWRDSAAVILGVGNVLKGDDAAGPLLCKRLAGRISAEVIDGGTAPENYLRPILNAAPEVLFIVDAADFGGRPGQVRLFGPERIRAFAFCTHALSLHLLLKVLHAERDCDVVLIGVQAKHARLGGCLSAAVQEAVETLARAFVQLFARHSGQIKP